MPIKEIGSREFVVTLPEDKGGKEIARIVASEASGTLLLKIGTGKITYKEAMKIQKEGISLLPIYAQYIGYALMEAAKLAEKALVDKPPEGST